MNSVVSMIFLLFTKCVPQTYLYGRINSEFMCFLRQILKIYQNKYNVVPENMIWAKRRYIEMNLFNLKGRVARVSKNMSSSEAFSLIWYKYLYTFKLSFHSETSRRVLSFFLYR